jgi:hypothetical protein
MSTIIAKNDSTAEIFIDDLGIGVPALDEINLTQLFEKEEIVGSDDLDTLVSNGLLIINDGTDDLSISDGLKHINLQTEYEDSFDEAIESGSSPPDSTSVIWINSNDHFTYSWDDYRQKWLSISRANFVFSTDKAKGIYLRIGIISDASASYYMHRAATIVGIFCTSGAGDNTKTFTIRDGAQGDLDIFSFSYSGSLEYANSLVNVDLNQYAKIKCWVSETGDNVENTVCQVEVAWRYIS